MSKRNDQRLSQDAWEHSNQPLVQIDPSDARFEVEMARRFNEALQPGWWDVGERR